MTFSSKTTGAYRASGGSAMQNGSMEPNLATTTPRQRCNYRNLNRSNAIGDNRVSGWRTV